MQTNFIHKIGLILVSLLVLAGVSYSQTPGQSSTVRTRSTVPASCISGLEFYSDTSGSNSVLRYCYKANTFGYLITSTNLGTANQVATANGDGTYTFVTSGIPVNNNGETTCATQTLNVLDRTTVIFCSGGTTSTFTFPVHTTAGFGSFFPMAIVNNNTGNMTLTPTTDTIDRNTVLPNWADFLYNDSNGNWRTIQFPQFSAFGSTCGSGLTWSTSLGFGCLSAAPVKSGDAAGGSLAGTYPNPTLASQYTKLRCEPGLGDGLNAVTSGTYLQTNCYNDSGVTWTITGIKCFTDNSGTSTLNATNGAGTGLLTGAVTCSSAFATGTQSTTTTIANGDYIKFTFVADGTSKQTTWVVSMTQ